MSASIVEVFNNTENELSVLKACQALLVIHDL